MAFIDANGRRVSTESAYLSPEVLERANLTVATGTHVSKVEIEHVVGKPPRAVAVRFKDSYGSESEVRARHQIILSSVIPFPCHQTDSQQSDSAGAVHTPQVFQRHILRQYA